MARKVILAPPAPPVPKKLKNYIAIVVDASSSMAGLQADVIKNFNDLLNSIKATDAQENQESIISFYSFADLVTVLMANVPVSAIKPLDMTTYVPNGNTALLDATGQAIQQLEATFIPADVDAAYLVMVLTDGEENRSQKFGTGTLAVLMNRVQATDRWTLTFQLPPGKKNRFCLTFGIPEGNCIEWEATAQGMREQSLYTANSYTGYALARKLGQTNVKSYYATTDLSDLSSAAVKTALTDVQTRFTAIPVTREIEIRALVEEAMKKPYSVGTAYYQLTKTEKVNGGKQILIQEKGKRPIYGGHEARTLIGLPTGAEAHVKPGNHANYDIFVQSTSTNRKLVRGTKLLVEK